MVHIGHSFGGVDDEIYYVLLYFILQRRARLKEQSTPSVFVKGNKVVRNRFRHQHLRTSGLCEPYQTLFLEGLATRDYLGP